MGSAGSTPKAVVVVGVDGSEPSARALRWAAEEAASRDGELEVVHVWERPQVYGSMGIGAYPVDPQPSQDEARKVLDRALADARAMVPTVTVHGRLEEGGPGAVLVDASHHADLLVVGSRGLGGLRSLLLGSVSRQAAHEGACPVVIVPTRRDGPTNE